VPPSIEQEDIRGAQLSPWICQQIKDISIKIMSKLNDKLISILRSHFYYGELVLFASLEKCVLRQEYKCDNIL